MKFVISLALIAAVVSSAGRTGDASAARNQYVSCRVELNNNALRPGSTGELLITLVPARGIHINLNPPISFAFEGSSAVTPKGRLEIPKKDKYLDGTKAIRQSFRVPASATPGTMVIRGTIMYYYCSDAQGWCSRFKQPVELSVRVVK